MATTLGVAVATHHVALTLVAQRRTGPITLDQVLLETDADPMTSPADGLQQVLAEVQRIIAILGTHKRPLSRIAVAAVEAMAASAAISVVEALTEAGLDSATLVPPPSTQSLAKRHPSNPNLFAERTEIPSRTAALTAAHEIALEALALIPDVSGRALGGGRTRRAMAVGATALVTVGVGLFGFRLLSDQSSPDVSPVQATDPVPTQDTAVSHDTTSTGVDRERRPHPSGCRHDHQCANHGRGDSTPHCGAGAGARSAAQQCRAPAAIAGRHATARVRAGEPGAPITIAIAGRACPADITSRRACCPN